MLVFYQTGCLGYVLGHLFHNQHTDMQIYPYFISEEQHRQPSGQALLNTVMVRLGGLLLLMLIVGRWADVLHILLCFIGEAACLLPAQALLSNTSNVSGN